MQAFTDLVGSVVLPAHCLDSTELTDLPPALDTAAAVHDVTAQASEAGRQNIVVNVMNPSSHRVLRIWRQDPAI
tara:strand:+ start:231 stop:452 length:222 start_codon:yes stop_codon:yes gene_type:complete